jgi:hypothetical protein
MRSRSGLAYLIVRRGLDLLEVARLRVAGEPLAEGVDGAGYPGSVLLVAVALRPLRG